MTASIASWLHSSAMHIGDRALAASAAVAIAFWVLLLSIATSELILRFAAILYVKDPYLRREQARGWVGELRAMSPEDRPGYATSLLWVSLVRLATHSDERNRTTSRSRAHDLLTNSAIFAVSPDGAEVPMTYDAEEDALEFTSSFHDPVTGATGLHFPMHQEGDTATILIMYQYVGRRSRRARLRRWISSKLRPSTQNTDD
jgi:hypothetical protein